MSPCLWDPLRVPGPLAVHSYGEFIASQETPHTDLQAIILQDVCRELAGLTSLHNSHAASLKSTYRIQSGQFAMMTMV